MSIGEIFSKLYDVLTKYEAVYLFYLVPIAYFMSIVFRLVYYKLKYHRKLYPQDIMAVATMSLIGVDYINYLYLLISKTGRVLPFPAFLIKYTFGFLLWIWMFWYSYKVYLKRNLTRETFLRKGRVVLACIVSMLVILTVIIIVVAHE